MGLTKFARRSDLEASLNKRLHRVLEGRTITVLLHEGKPYCLDSKCYHMGGPLGELGDIEEYNGTSCIRCPWHNYRFSLETGGQLEKNLQGNVCEGASKQRVHPAYLDVDNVIWVDVRNFGHAHARCDKHNDIAHKSIVVGGIKQGVRATGLAPRGLEGSLLGTSKVSHGLEYEAQQAYAPGLVPYAGVARKAMPPSPVKPPQAQIAFASRRNLSGNFERSLEVQPAAKPAAFHTPSVTQKSLFDFYSRAPMVVDAASDVAVDMEF